MKKTAEEISLEYGLCTCSDIYTSRNLQAPDCPLHAFAVTEAMEEYADQFKPKWIPVEERLPEFGEDYNVVIDLKDGLGDPVVGSVEWDGVNKVFCYQGTDIQVEGITHWMPLPSAPERKEEEV